jgi:hypothetical protein
MKNSCLFLFFAVFAVGAWAQPAVSRDNAPVQTAPEQRRAELRSALKAPRGREAQDKDQVRENVPENRHLSAQERADLRQQLRQQRRDAQLDHP